MVAPNIFEGAGLKRTHGFALTKSRKFDRAEYM